MRPGYKQTEVGVIPDEWDSPRLDALGDGKRPPIKAGPFGSNLTKDQYVPAGFKVYGQEQVIAGDVAFGDYFISPKKYRELESCAVQPGDILLSLVGTIGRLLEIPDGALPGVINPRLLRVSLDRKRVFPRFFKFLFESGTIQSRLEQQAQGGTMGVLNAGVLRPFQIALPPLTEQRAIAAALSDVDALLGGLDRLIAKKRDLKQAAMQQLLTCQTRLPGFSGEWEVKRLGEVLKFQVGCPFSSAFFNEKEQGVRLVKNRDLKSDGQVFHYSGKYDPAFQVSDGDVLIGMDGDFLPCRWSKGPALLNQRVGRIVALDGLDREFAFYYLIGPLKEIEVATASTTVKHLSHGDIEGIEKPLPSVPEQTAIATILSDMDAELAVLEARRDKTRDLKQAMMQELLTGKTRLVPAGVAHA